jgi:hypothetical protein
MPKPIVARNNSLYVRREPTNGKPYYVHHKQSIEAKQSVESFLAELNEGYETGAASEILG